MWFRDEVQFSDLVGVTLDVVKEYRDSVHFDANDGRSWRMYHSQDCCEHVSIEDINGDLDDLVGSPILFANVETSNDSGDLPIEWRSKAEIVLDVMTRQPGYQRSEESETWTFYRIGTVKGTVIIRWYGSSNGYYSESVSFEKA